MRTAHYIPQLKTTKIPPLHLVIDTEAKIIKRAGYYRHQWAVGGLTPLHWNTEFESFECGPSMAVFDAADLWAAYDTDPALHRVYWAHNLAYDMRVGEALKHLPAAGFQPEAVSLVRMATWAAFKHPDGRRVTLMDLWSWCPVPLDVIAKDMGLDRGDFNYDGATRAELAGRCCQDSLVAALAVRYLLEFISSENLGTLKTTGSSQCHAAWRRRFMPPKSVLVHTDEIALDRERKAMHAGRTEAWRHGPHTGKITEVDMSLAYCRIAAHHMVPGKLSHHRGAVKNAEYADLRKRYCVLADVTVTTDQPLVPVSEDDRVYWPVGTFATTLWGPEIDLLLASLPSSAVRIQRVWLYHPTAAFTGMAQWLIDQLADNDVSPVVKRMLKHWARALIGRCAMRYRSWQPWGESGIDELLISYDQADEADTIRTLLHIGRKIMYLSDVTEATSSVPQVTGWVMSQCRVDLWHLMQYVHLDRVLYCDTDGVLVRDDRPVGGGIPQMDTAHVRIAVKNTYSGATIRGPRNLDVDTDRRISGIPKRAVEVGPLEFDGEIWAGLETSLARKHPTVVQAFEHRWQVAPRDLRREHHSDGSTSPYRIEPDETI